MTLKDTSDSSDTNLVRYPYRRGATVVGADGEIVGTLEQLVVDRESGVLRSLILRSADGEREFELPEERVSQNEGDTVHLSVRADDLASHPELARPYDPREFQPVPPGEPAGHDRASRIALETGQPVVTSVGDNAADVIAPESPDAPSRNGGMAAHGVGLQPARQDDSTAQKTTDGAPDVTASGPALSDAEQAAPSPEGEPPPRTPSAAETTTGELISGKPSTGGMGSASVTPVQSYSQDASPQDASPAPTESLGEADPANPTTGTGTVEPLLEGGDRPEFSSPAAPSAQAVADEGARSGWVAPPASQQMPAAAPAGEQVAPLTFSRAPSLPSQMQRPSWATPGMLTTGISVGVGVLAGVVMRRRQQHPRTRAQGAAKSAQPTVTETLQARRQAARSAKRAARRGRWFRRGVVLGAALGILFAPQPGAQLRERLRDAARQRFPRGA